MQDLLSLLNQTRIITSHQSSQARRVKSSLSFKFQELIHPLTLWQHAQFSFVMQMFILNGLNSFGFFQKTELMATSDAIVSSLIPLSSKASSQAWIATQHFERYEELMKGVICWSSSLMIKYKSCCHSMTSV